VARRLKNTTEGYVLHIASGTSLAPGFNDISPDTADRMLDTQMFEWFSNGTVQFDDGATTFTDPADGWLRFQGSPQRFPQNPRGQMMVEPSLRVGAPGTRGMSLLTPLLTDKTTWYQRSVRVTDQALTDSGDHQSYSALAPWINIRHPYLFYNEFMIPLRTGSFAKHSDFDVIVMKNGVVQSSGFSVDHLLGKVTFDSPLDPGDTVTASFNHLNEVSRASEWILTPPAGYKYVVEHVEMQFSIDIGAFSDVIRFEIWANPAFTTGSPKVTNVAAYDGVSWAEPYFGSAWPNGPTAMGQHRSRYRNFTDIINAANEGKGTIPVCSEITTETLVVPFNYLQSFVIDSQMGTVFRLILEGDSELTANHGKLATATFYVQLSPSGT